MKNIIESISSDVKLKVCEMMRKRAKSIYWHDRNGSDFFFYERVVAMSRQIAAEEKVNQWYCEIMSWMMGIHSHRLHKGEFPLAIFMLVEGGLEKSTAEILYNDIGVIDGRVNKSHFPKEIDCVLDAIDLDKIGALGIVNQCAHDGLMGKKIYHPADLVEIKTKKTTSKQKEQSTIHTFYENHFHIKDNMRTNTGRKIAKERHAFMESFLNQFFQEWNGQK